MHLSTQYSELNKGFSLVSPTNAHTLIALAIPSCTSASQKEFTKQLTRKLRDVSAGWSNAELPFTPIAHPKAGRPRAIDYFHTVEKIGIELELSNQTCFSHDLLKLETAFRCGYIRAGAILTVIDSAACRSGWNRKRNNSYLTFETAKIYLEIFSVSLTVPLALMGIEFDV